MEREVHPPINAELLHNQVKDIAYNMLVDRFNAFLKFKGLEDEFSNFSIPDPPVSETTQQLRSHEYRPDVGQYVHWLW